MQPTKPYQQVVQSITLVSQRQLAHKCILVWFEERIKGVFVVTSHFKRFFSSNHNTHVKSLLIFKRSTTIPASPRTRNEDSGGSEVSLLSTRVKDPVEFYSFLSCHAES
jgi:hypothetical protein